MEIWKTIENFEGFYEVSNFGKVRSLDRVLNNGNKATGQILKQKTDKDGYKRVGFCKNGERYHFIVHRLVATAFIPNTYNLPYINHKDGVRDNNHVDNLEWCDNSYNQWHRCHINNNPPNNDYKKQKVVAIHENRYELSFDSVAECAIYFKVSRTCINRKINNKSSNPSYATKIPQLKGVYFKYV